MDDQGQPHKDLRKHRAGSVPAPRMMSPSGRNVAILILLGAFLIIAGIEYYSLQAYFWYQRGIKPVPQTGRDQGTEGSIQLPTLQTSNTPGIITATPPPSPLKTSIPTDSQAPPKPTTGPSGTPSVSPTPSASATKSSTPPTTLSPTSATPGTRTVSPTPIETQEPTITSTPTSLPTATRTTTATPES